MTAAFELRTGHRLEARTPFRGWVCRRCHRNFRAEDLDVVGLDAMARQSCQGLPVGQLTDVAFDETTRFTDDAWKAMAAKGGAFERLGVSAEEVARWMGRAPSIPHQPLTPAEAAAGVGRYEPMSVGFEPQPPPRPRDDRRLRDLLLETQPEPRPAPPPAGGWWGQLMRLLFMRSVPPEGAPARRRRRRRPRRDIP